MRKIFMAIFGILTLAIGSASAQVTVVNIDIKPGSCPNPFNGKSKGVVPVAIVGSEDLDITTIDPATIQLEGVLPHTEGETDNSTEPINDNNEDCFTCFDADDPANFNCDLWDETDIEPVPGEDGIDDTYCGDEYLDLIVKFDTQELAKVEAIHNAEVGDCVELMLTGETIDGTLIEGYDSILVRKKGKD